MFYDGIDACAERMGAECVSNQCGWMAGVGGSVRLNVYILPVRLF